MQSSTRNEAPKLSPRVRELLRDGTRFLDNDDVLGAERSATCALALVPEHVQALALFARVLRRRGKSDEAVTFLRGAVAIHPHDPSLLYELAAAHSDLAQFEAAIEWFKQLLPLRPDSQAWFGIGIAYDRSSQGEAALLAAQKAVRLAPRHMPSRFLLARALTATGNIEEATHTYRNLTRLPAEAAKAWYGLLDLKTVRISDAELASIERLESDPRVTDNDRMLAAFALGQAYEACGRYAEAYEAVERANGLRRRGIEWSADAHTRHVREIERTFSGPVASASDRLGEEVIFIVGLPRSGSTMVEQILAAHADVVGAGELAHLDAVLTAESTSRGQTFPEWVPAATAQDWERLGRSYLDLTKRWQTGRHFTDKLPENWKYVGAIRAMLPGARIIGAERNLVETCWSCYKQLFAPGRIAYSYSVIELARYAQDCRHLWRYWQRRDARHCRTQSYEAIQTHPETQVRELLEFCGLEYDPACLEFHASKRNVRTASAAQVRQPLSQNTARAARYGEVLAPLATAIECVSIVEQVDTPPPTSDRA